jgi:hypothetical protein
MITINRKLMFTRPTCSYTNDGFADKHLIVHHQINIMMIKKTPPRLITFHRP